MRLLTRFTKKLFPRQPWRHAWQNFRRHSTLTFATVSIMALMVFIFNVVFSIRLLTDEIFGFLNEKVDISIEFRDDADELKIADLVTTLSQQEFVKDVVYISQGDALETVDKELIPGYKVFLERNDLDNPFQPSLNIITPQIADHERVFDFLLTPPFVNLVSDKSVLFMKGIDDGTGDVLRDSASSELRGFSGLINTVLLLTLFIFAIAALAILVNAIYLSLRAKKKELTIMHLVGANESFIILPYTYEGMLYGAVSSAVGLLLFYVLVIFGGWELFPLLFSVPRIILQILFVVFLSGGVSYLVVKQHLRGKVKL